jgi:NAD(P)H-flavin reductase
LAKLKVGDRLGIRGPYGRGWPLHQAEGRDIVLMTGGLGCAPAVSVIHYVMRRREQFGRLVIMQGVKHEDDLIWRERYSRWSQMPDTQVLLAADVAGPAWPFMVGRVITLLDQAEFDHDNSTVMMCGPEIMMRFTVENLLTRGLHESDIWLSMERNMQCALGHCGHCQYGGKFICKDGPVFPYEEIKGLFGIKGF